MKKQLHLDTFVNSFGQELNPGDKIAFCTTGYSHRVNFEQGTYVGYILGEDWHGREYKKVKVQYETETWGGKKIHRVSTLQCNRIAKLG